MSKNRRTLIEPKCITVHRCRDNDNSDPVNFEIQVSVNQCPRLLFRELQEVFPSIARTENGVTRDNLLILPTFQKSRQSLMEFTEESEAEKDRLLHQFILFSETLIKHIGTLVFSDNSNSNCNYWIDYTDPVTGYPMRSDRGGMTYSDVDAIEQILPYTIDTSLQCRVVSHPQWGIDVYPATIFTNVPVDVVRQALHGMESNRDCSCKSSMQ